MGTAGMLAADGAPEIIVLEFRVIQRILIDFSSHKRWMVGIVVFIAFYSSVGLYNFDQSRLVVVFVS